VRVNEVGKAQSRARAEVRVATLARGVPLAPPSRARRDLCAPDNPIMVNTSGVRETRLHRGQEDHCPEGLN
jgi:hypothetical protein